MPRSSVVTILAETWQMCHNKRRNQRNHLSDIIIGSLNVDDGLWQLSRGIVQ